MLEGGLGVGVWWRNPLPITLCYSFREVEYIRCSTPRSVSGQDQSHFDFCLFDQV
jgi:hypothetical protein